MSIGIYKYVERVLSLRWSSGNVILRKRVSDRLVILPSTTETGVAARWYLNSPSYKLGVYCFVPSVIISMVLFPKSREKYNVTCQ